ncbi:ribonuclease HII [Alphaproteobacteria bacterium]|nr:ribonuclease HII [Alphaproteobacteria bacterium]
MTALLTSADLKSSRPIIGVDEAGRGPLAGPVVAAAYTFHCPDFEKEMAAILDDSKKLTAKKREMLFDKLHHDAQKGEGCTISLPADVIDDINIYQATMRAMTEAVFGLTLDNERPIYIDGNARPAGLPQSHPVVKGDGKIAAIAAASILAKVSRDRDMMQLHQLHPHFDWHKNKGYGTKTHLQALRDHGTTSYHRMSFHPCAEAAGISKQGSLL